MKGISHRYKVLHVVKTYRQQNDELRMNKDKNEEFTENTTDEKRVIIVIANS